MIWSLLYSSSAKHSLKKVAQQDLKRIKNALNDMRASPFNGNVVPLRGVHKGSFRRRVGTWRIFFDINMANKTIWISNISRRSSTTY